jgi:hypothetical protein
LPQSRDILARVPPHVRREFKRLMSDLPSGLRRPNAGDMVGALLLAARRAPEQLHEDLVTYFEIKDTWQADGTETLPEL